MDKNPNRNRNFLQLNRYEKAFYKITKNRGTEMKLNVLCFG
jgi:hypothetical protein